MDTNIKPDYEMQIEDWWNNDYPPTFPVILTTSRCPDSIHYEVIVSNDQIAYELGDNWVVVWSIMVDSAIKDEYYFMAIEEEQKRIVNKWIEHIKGLK